MKCRDRTECQRGKRNVTARKLDALYISENPTLCVDVIVTLVDAGTRKLFLFIFGHPGYWIVSLSPVFINSSVILDLQMKEVESVNNK